jgi:hypothetical protein
MLTDTGRAGIEPVYECASYQQEKGYGRFDERLKQRFP